MSSTSHSHPKSMTDAIFELSMRNNILQIRIMCLLELVLLRMAGIAMEFYCKFLVLNDSIEFLNELTDNSCWIYLDQYRFINRVKVDVLSPPNEDIDA